MCGVAGTVIMPRFVLQALSSHLRFVLQVLLFIAAVGVVVQSHLLCGCGGCRHTMLCHGHGCCMAMVGVVALHGVVVMVGVITPHGVLWSWPSCHGD